MKKAGKATDERIRGHSANHACAEADAQQVGHRTRSGRQIHRERERENTREE